MTRAAIDGMAKAGGRPTLLRAVAWILFFAALHGIFRFLARRGLLVTARRVEQALRRDLFAHVVRLPLSFFGRTLTGDVMSRLTNDVSAVWLLLGPGVLTLTGTVISYLLALGFMVRISFPLTLVSAALAPAIVFASRGYGRAFHRLHRKVQESLSAMNAAIQENVSGIRLVKAYNLECREEKRFEERCRDYYRDSVAVSRTSAAFHGLIGLLSGTGVAVVLGVGGWLVIRRDLTLGGFVAFNAYLAMLAFPTMALGWVINLFQRGAAAMGRINEFLRLPSEPQGLDQKEEAAGGGRAGGTCGPFSGAAADAGSAAHRGGAAAAACAGLTEEGAKAPPLLVVRDLWFAYDRTERGEVLRGVTFRVNRGELVGLIGPTGGGKSTLLCLLPRLLDAPPGSIFLDGRDVCSIPLPDLRSRIALVAQDPFLFSETILENIAFALPAPDREAAREAARRARFLARIEEMPASLDTVVGERGISLSGGERQRVTIARALCSGREFLLLDDALSSVDSETEAEIFEELLAARGSRTILFSTHRMASLPRCDRILVLSGGRIVEEGTHEELFALRGVYFDLYSRQMLARELERS